MYRGVKAAAAATVVLGLAALGLSACEDDESTAQKSSEARNKSVTELREKQPVQTMKYSPTLNTVGKWAKTWGQEGKVSYVYMQREDGTFAGYYVLDGLPVNYCVNTAPPYTMEDLPGDKDSADQKVEAPTIDGAYYGGCDPSRFYGFDAVTGQYMEWTDGNVLTAVVSDQPLALKNQPAPFGSSIEDVKKAQQ